MENDQFSVLYIPSVTEIYDFAFESLQNLPKSFRILLQNFTIEVKNFAERAVLDDLTIKERYDLLGLYRGVPIPLKRRTRNKQLDIIFLYRCPLIRHALENHEDVKTLVHHVLINEIAHHFGCSANEMAWVQQHSKFPCKE